jgi:hypothetical protein
MSEQDVRTQVVRLSTPKAEADSLHRRSQKDEKPEVIDFDLGVDRVVSRLERSLGMVIDVELCDGDTLCGVLGAVNSDVLILEHWEESTLRPNGDPFTVSVDQVRQIVIP